MDALLGVVEGLRQEVKLLQLAVQAVTNSGNSLPMPTPPEVTSFPRSRSSVPSSRRGAERNGSCWECGCDRHIRRDCPYLQGN